jgi:HAD superfamily hydrolase (TIGR01509 family)
MSWADLDPVGSSTRQAAGCPLSDTPEGSDTSEGQPQDFAKCRTGEGKRIVSPRAVLFDLDGTLLDSDPYWRQAWQALTTARHAEVPDGVLDGLTGLSTSDAVSTVHGRLRWDGDVATDVAWLEARVGEALRRHVAWLPGALRFVSEVRAAGLATALVTSSSRTLVDSVLPDRRPDLFDVIVCGDDVSHPKPDPAPYLRAADLLGLSPADCVAVEDSPTGIASATAAGCIVVCIGYTEPPSRAVISASALDDLNAATLLSLAQ